MNLHKLKPSPAMVVALLGLFFGLSGLGVAASGGNFILGASNTANSQTSLAASIGGPTLAVSNGSDGPALRGDSSLGRGLLAKHNASTGTAPAVDAITASTAAGASALTATNLNGGPAAIFKVKNNGIAPFAVNSTGRVPNLDADLVDGKHAADFMPASGLTHFSYSSAGFIGATNINLYRVWTAGDPATSVHSQTDGDGDVVLPMDLPNTILGKPVKLQFLTICHALANSGAQITGTKLWMDGQGSAIYQDSIARTSGVDRTCYTLLLGGLPVTGPLLLHLHAHFDSYLYSFYLYPVELIVST